MLEHLEHHHVASFEQALPLVRREWTVFHFPPKGRNHKAALYGRMWKFRELGIDAMVRQLADGEYVIVSRDERR